MLSVILEIPPLPQLSKHQLSTFKNHTYRNSRLIRTAVYLLPTIKNPSNLALITSETVFSPVVIPSLPNTPIDLEVPLLLSDGFRAASIRKAQITDPTISPQEWALKILESLEYVSIQYQWKSLPPLAGIIQATSRSRLNQHKSNQLVLDKASTRRFQQVFVDFINNTLRYYSGPEPNIRQIPSALLALAVAFPELEDDYRKQLSTPLLLPSVIELVYISPFGLNAGSFLKLVALDRDSTDLNEILNKRPVLTFLNSLSLIIQFLIHNSHPTRDAGTISVALNLIATFTRSLSTEYQDLARSIGADEAEQNTHVWRYLKLSLFSVSVSFQGYTTWLLQDLPRQLFLEHAVAVSSTILEAFSNIYFIVAQISLSGFPTYDFVYYSCMDIILDPQFKLDGISSVVENLASPYLATSGTANSYHFIEGNLVNRGKLIFALNVCELLTPLSPFHPRKSSEGSHETVAISSCIMPLAKKFLTAPDPKTSKVTITFFQPILESAHSVFLSIISTPSQALERNNGSRNSETLSDTQQMSTAPDDIDSQTDLYETKKFLDDEIPSYLSTVLDLFPGVLSPNQFTLAITSIVRAFSPPSPMFTVNKERSQWILEQIYSKALEMKPGKPLPALIGTHQQQLNNTENEQNKDDKNIPIPTTRAVVISSLIHSLPFVEVSLLEEWLNKVAKLTLNPSQADKSKFGIAYPLEQQFLEADLFQMISEELEQYKSNVGIRWWFKARL